MKNRFLSLIALIISLFVFLTSCSQPQDDGKYTLNGVALEEYRIVYCEDEYGYGRDSAKILRSRLEELTGIMLRIAEDTKEPAEYEIVLGDTNRSEKLKMDELDALDYAVAADGKRVLLNAGEPYMLETVSNKFLQMYSEHRKLTVSETPITETFEFEKPNSVILIIGDGMGFNHINYSLENGVDTFIGNIMPNKGSCKTDSLSGTTDSAAASTALSTGYKTTNGRVGRDKNGNNLKIMGELAIEKQKALMVMSNYKITDATPAGFTAHADSRKDTEDIEKGQSGLDSLVLEQISENTLEGFLNALDRYEKLETKNGFFLMNEDGYCDSAGHNNEFNHAVGAVSRIDKIARAAISYLFKHPDTVLIITADHETGGITYNEEKGEWEFTTTNHTSADVPVYAMGYGTETFNNKTVDNTDISRFIACILGDSNWGDPNLPMNIELPR